jgi:hypothetical protein
MRPVEIGPEKDCSGKAQQQLQMSHPSSRQRVRLIITYPQLCKKISRRMINWSPTKDAGLTPGQTGLLAVGSKITLTLLDFAECVSMCVCWDKQVIGRDPDRTVGRVIELLVTSRNSSRIWS